MHEYLLPTTTTNDERVRAAHVAVLPIGSFEQHGAHLPLATDTIIACTIMRAISGNYPVFTLPPITISCSHEHSAWPGTVSISARTLYSVVADIYESLSRSGPRILVLINGHGGNYVLSNVVQEGNATGKTLGLFPSRDDWESARRSAQLESTSHEDMHAGEIETSILLHAHPRLVREVCPSIDRVANDRRHFLSTGLQKYTDNGVIGRPSLATAAKGKAILDSLVGDFGRTLDIF